MLFLCSGRIVKIFIGINNVKGVIHLWITRNLRNALYASWSANYAIRYIVDSLSIEKSVSCTDSMNLIFFPFEYLLLMQLLLWRKLFMKPASYKRALVVCLSLSRNINIPQRMIIFGNEFINLTFHFCSIIFYKNIIFNNWLVYIWTNSEGRAFVFY